jgi:hypothetical protein
MLVSLTVAATLGGSSRSRVVPSLSLLSLVVPANARALGTTEEAVRGIAAIISSRLGLSVPDHLTVHVYGGRLAFEQGLIRDGRVSPLLAAEMSDFAIGVVTRGQVLLYDRPRDRSDREWLRLIAHELTHVAQVQLAGGEGRGEQWLAEGMAEWVAYSTLEQLGVDALGRRRMRRRRTFTCTRRCWRAGSISRPAALRAASPTGTCARARSRPISSRFS